MSKKLVAIRDSKTEVFGQPVMVHNLAHGERMFHDLVDDKSTDIGKHPEDFSLWCLGAYNEELGQISTDGCPFVVTEAKHE